MAQSKGLKMSQDITWTFIMSLFFWRYKFSPKQFDLSLFVNYITTLRNVRKSTCTYSIWIWQKKLFYPIWFAPPVFVCLGIIKLRRSPPPRLRGPQYVLNITATDDNASGGPYPLSSSAQVIVGINDINNNKPLFKEVSRVIIYFYVIAN